MTREFKSVIMLLISAIIWGFSYVAQALGLQEVGPFTFNTALPVVVPIIPICWKFVATVIKSPHNEPNMIVLFKEKTSFL